MRHADQAGQLDMKIGSSEKVDRIFQMGAAGLKFAHQPTPPRTPAGDPGHELLPGQPRRRKNGRTSGNR